MKKIILWIMSGAAVVAGAFFYRNSREVWE